MVSPAAPGVSPEPVVLRPPQVLDLTACSALSASLLEAYEGRRPVVVDLGEVAFVDSSALAVLVGASRRGRAADCSVTVINPTALVDAVLRMTGLGRLLDVRRDAVG